jgi:hypothetical protein
VTVVLLALCRAMKFKVYGAVYDNILINIARALSLGVTYGIIETYVPLNQIPVYRILYILMLSLPFISRNLWLWIGDATLCMLVQDITYWVYINQKPWQWSWYYPVVYGVPLLYPFAVAIIILAYRRAFNLFS